MKTVEQMKREMRELLTSQRENAERMQMHPWGHRWVAACPQTGHTVRIAGGMWPSPDRPQQVAMWARRDQAARAIDRMDRAAIEIVPMRAKDAADLELSVIAASLEMLEK